MANLSDFPSSPIVEATNLSDTVSNISAANISADVAALDSVAQDFSVEDFGTLRSPASSTEDCSDIHGTYYNKKGHEVTVYQVGCFLKVRMYWDGEVGEVLKPGRIVGDDFRIQDFRKPGRVGTVGDLFFGDDASWSKNKQDAATLDAVGAVAVSVATQGARGLPNTAIVNIALANKTGNFSGSFGKSSDESKSSDDSNTSTNTSANTSVNASEWNISLNSTLSSTSSVVQAAGDDDEDFLVDENCPDATGTYETNAGGQLQEVTVYQIGCFLKVKGLFNGEMT